MSAVDHPAHYHAESGFECIDVIQRAGLGFCAGNALKYLSRYMHKGSPGQDLDKCLWYLKRALASGEPRVMPMRVPDQKPMFVHHVSRAWGLSIGAQGVLEAILAGDYGKAATRLTIMQADGLLPTAREPAP